MKLVKKAAAFAACAGLALCLAGCQQKAPEESDAPDQAGTLEVEDTASAEPFYVLVVGNDSRTGTVDIDKANYADGSGRSDTMMLVRIDPKTYAVSIITVPRDTATPFGGSTTKLNEVYHSSGIEAAVDEVAKLTGVKAEYYLDMGFVDFEKFVSELGGVTASVPIDMHLQDIVSGDQVELSQGVQDLNGAEALVLARSRKQYANDLDACRQIQDRQLVEVGIQKVAADPANAAAHVDTLMANVKTNWPKSDLVKTVSDFAANADKITFQSGTGPYAGDIDESAGGLWLAVRDEATWKELIAVVEAGGDPTTVVPLPNVAAAN